MTDYYSLSAAAGLLGGGSGGGYTLDDIASGAVPSGDIVISADTIAPYAFTANTAITGVTIPDACAINRSAFDSVSARFIHAPKSRLIGGNTFTYCANLTTLVIGAMGSGATSDGQYAARYCGKLSALDVSMGVKFNTQCLMNDTALHVIVLRPTQIVPLGTTNAFTGTPFASGGAGGDIYIPKSLYDQLGTGTNDYKAATNWATIDSYGTITWHPIEGSIYETQYVDGIPIS